MYILFGLFLILCLFFFVIFHFRKRKLLRKIRTMDRSQKLRLLRELTLPFGFFYQEPQDVISSTFHPWQREFGYHHLFDRSATHFNMVFDCEPVYFDYDGRTWLIEFWKGQYGINTGAEIGVYYADTIIKPSAYKRTHFQSVPDEQMLPLSMTLFVNGTQTPLFSLSRRHWWLTGFRMGKYNEPEELTMQASVAFPNHDMMQSFLTGMLAIGYCEYDLKVCGLTVSFEFSTPRSAQPRKKRPLSTLAARWKNKFFNSLYLFVTRHFSASSDRLLYLSFFLPSAFRKMIFFRRNRRQKMPKRRRTHS